ncbi:MAG: FAD-binding protein [Clostridiales bacterium]|nr:FAD-binding protein [Clostridiales bacterium]
MEYQKNELSCDVLVVGGGVGGLTCAIEIKEKNPALDVLIIEKQTAGYGGKANKGGGVLQYFDLTKMTPDEFVTFHVKNIGCYLGDQDIMRKYVEMNNEMLDKLAGWGCNLPKNEDGSYFVIPTGPMTSMITVDLDITLQMRRRAEKLGCRIMDKTTMAELFTENGRIIGAAAYSILDGSFYVISAGNVVLATGSQNYRFASMWSSGRGDGIAAAYRAGAEMRNAEFGNFAQIAKVKSHDEVVFGENNMYNALGEFITPHFRSYRETDINSNAIREWYLQMQAGTGPVHLEYDQPAGRGTEGGKEGGGDHGGGADMARLFDRPYGRKFRMLNTQSSSSIDTDMEICPLFIGEQSPIRVDNDMHTSIKGLYAIGDCSYAGSAAPGAVPAPPGRNRGSGILNAVFAGIICGDTIAASKLPEAIAVSAEKVAACEQKVYAPLNRTSGNQAKEVIDLIQQAMVPVEQSIIMEASRMQKAKALIAQAKELAGDMVAEDFHGLLACHEAEAMVLCAEMHYAASEMRRESRGWFLREDYPDIDNENWLKWIIIQNVDGEMTLRTEDVPVEKWPNKPE